MTNNNTLNKKEVLEMLENLTGKLNNEAIEIIKNDEPFDFEKYSKIRAQQDIVWELIFKLEEM